MIRSHANYVWTVFRHKCLVFKYGLKLKVPFFRLLKHDISKLLPPEYVGYIKKFYDHSCSDMEWLQCWNHHVNANPHHPEFWVSRSNTKIQILPMPRKFVAEMLADWMAAGEVYKKKKVDLNDWEWFEKHYTNFPFHPHTKIELFRLFHYLKSKYADIVFNSILDHGIQRISDKSS